MPTPALRSLRQRLVRFVRCHSRRQTADQTSTEEMETYFLLNAGLFQERERHGRLLARAYRFDGIRPD